MVRTCVCCVAGIWGGHSPQQAHSSWHLPGTKIRPCSRNVIGRFVFSQHRLQCVEKCPDTLEHGTATTDASISTPAFRLLHSTVEMPGDSWKEQSVEISTQGSSIGCTSTQLENRHRHSWQLPVNKTSRAITHARSEVTRSVDQASDGSNIMTRTGLQVDGQ